MFETGDLHLDARRTYTSVSDPHRDTIEWTDIPNQKRIWDAEKASWQAQREIDKDQFKGCEHTTFQHTARAIALLIEGALFSGRMRR